MARVYLSCSDIHSLSLLPLCQSALEAAGHSHLWVSDLVIDGGLCQEANWGEVMEGGITFPCPPEILARLPELIRQKEEADERFRQAEEARKRAKAVWERLEGLPDFKRGGKTFKVFVEKYRDPLIGCFKPYDLDECDLSDGVSISQVKERSKKNPKYFDYWKYLTLPLPDLGREEGYSDQELVAVILETADKLLAALMVAEENHKARLAAMPKREYGWEDIGHAAALRRQQADAEWRLNRSFEDQWKD